VSDLNDLVEPLKRELAPPGEFETQYPSSDDDTLANTLMDAFAQAQLDGYFQDNVLDLDTGVVSPDLSAAGGALIVIYAGMQIIRAKLRAMNLSERYVAGSAEYEVRRSAQVLSDELEYLATRRDQILTQSRSANAVTHVMDAYITRQLADWSASGGLYPSEIG
jgi:hypothetical protein